ncbi:MAG: SAM-dependent methyltransferase [Micromonosporaceae bacterium]|nr:SAM-dependent methyltransferase [Micromonosporaceae bacterium]
MPEPLDPALAEIRAALLDPVGLRRAVAAGHRRDARPRWVRAELRPVSLKAGGALQVVTSDGVRPATRNCAWGEPAASAVDELLREPFGNWHVETAAGTLQLRVTRKGEAQVHRSAAVAAPLPAAHDRAREHLLDPGDPLFTVLGGSAAKRRQVDAFLRAIASTVDGDPGHVVDLGCGNAYLTFAAYRYFTAQGFQTTVTGVDVREDQRARNTALAQQLGCADRVRFVAGTILDAPVPQADTVLALHACDTATDEALARAVRWESTSVLAAPCCHHDIAAQLKRSAAPLAYQMIVRQPILRERLADVLTDGLRAALLRLYGYQTDVVEFVESRHTPRNVLLRARLGAGAPTAAQQEQYAELVRAWGVAPRLAQLLDYCM